MVYAFRFRVERTLKSLSLPSESLREIHAQENRVAGMQPPANLDQRTSAAVTDSIRQGFVFGFRIVMLVCAGLSAASAAIAWFMVPNTADPSGSIAHVT
jgi:hypothetical protein